MGVRESDINTLSYLKNKVSRDVSFVNKPPSHYNWEDDEKLLEFLKNLYVESNPYLLQKFKDMVNPVGLEDFIDEKYEDIKPELEDYFKKLISKPIREEPYSPPKLIITGGETTLTQPAPPKSRPAEPAFDVIAKPKIDPPKPTEKSIRETNLPNGMVNIKYEARVPYPNNRMITSSKWNDELVGLKFEKENANVSGIPTKSGKFILELSYRDFEESDQYKITINPDPKKLWKNIEPPQDDKFFKSNQESKFEKIGSRNIVSASKRGRSHAHEAKFREDDFRSSLGKNPDFAILIVSDGAGSASHSREGSKIVCESIEEYFTSNEKLLISSLSALLKEKDKKNKNPFLDYIKGAVESARAKISKIAVENKNEINEFAATCLFLIYLNFPKNKKTIIISFSIGDGAICIYGPKGAVRLLGKADSGQYSGETRFITSGEIFKDDQSFLDRINIELIDQDFTAIFLMTDGVSDPKFETDANLNNQKLWDSLWNELEEKGIFKSLKPEQELLEWLDFWSQGNHDDRTITILY